MKGYDYSVERAEFALLNKDGSYPTPRDWTHTKRATGEVVSHKGGLVGGTGPWDFSGFAGEALELLLTYGKTQKTVALDLAGVADASAVTASELAAAINAAFPEVSASVVTVGADYDAAYLKIVDKATGETALPWFAPFGFQGKIAERVGIIGWVATKDIKGSSAEPKVETGDTATATAGSGIRCSIKEPDRVTGKTLTITLSAKEEGIMSMIFGDDYDPETGDYFEKASDMEAPSFVYRNWVRRYPSGENTKATQSQMLLRSFPSCTGTPGGSSDEESGFATVEITADCAANSRSNMPSEFRKVASVTEYRNAVEV